MKYLIIYLLIINALSFLLMLVDKQKAKKNKWRIPESTLLGATLIGGSVGALAGMYAVRHKTKKPTFSVGIPILLLLQIVGIILWIVKSDTFI